ncbi:MAG: type II toxin-antitoxin system ParD family antitoxin [Phenylobacterium zucineum]|nr:MAG: type II toxin-antitoxin system ParD family antitoxin [Phenylobacterium zucineum]
MQINLPPELEAIVEEAVKSGRYATPEDALREAVSLLDENEAKFRALKREIEIGLNSPDAGPADAEFFADVKRRGRERLAALREAR